MSEIVCPSGWFPVFQYPDGSLRCESLTPCTSAGAIPGDCNPYTDVMFAVTATSAGTVVASPLDVELPATGLGETVGVFGAVLVAVGWLLLKVSARRHARGVGW